MAVIPSKPNTKLMWASQGNRAEPTSDKQLEGWTQEIPPHEMENWVQYKQDLAIKYLYQEGISEWDSSFEYLTYPLHLGKLLLNLMELHHLLQKKLERLKNLKGI